MIRAELEQSVTWLSQQLGQEPFDLAIVLGSGLGGLADEVESPCVFPYADIPHMPLPSARGHAGRLVAGMLAGWRSLVFQGRFHMYEGYSARQAALPVRMAHALGVRHLLLTNAVGGIHPDFQAGDFMYVADHLNFLGDNPLRGESHDPFIDLSRLYDQGPFDALAEFAADNNVRLHRGVLAGMLGPSYETPAEIRALRILGADVVSMSLIPEALMAGYLEMKVIGLSMISNAAAGISTVPLDHQEVLQAGQSAASDFRQLCRKLLAFWPS